MQWIFQLIIRYRNISSLLLTVFISLWMLSFDEPAGRNMARGLAMTVFFPFQYSFNQITRIRNTIAENRRLREELTNLSITVSMLSEQAAENIRLRDMLDVKDSMSYSLVPARVIAREPSSPYRGLVINAGKNFDIELYMPVVTRRGVVGKVVEVLPHISLVQVLQDPSARTSVMTKRSRSVGILETEDGRTFFIHHRKHLDVANGDTVVTTGLGGIFPKGLTVGFVTDVREINDPLFKKTILETSVDFEHVEELFVMSLSPEWTAVRGEMDSLEAAK